MTQTVPATAVLGPGKTGLAIGLRVLNLDGTVYSAFSTTDVAETSTAGTYRKANGVVAPLAGGYIVWGTALVDYAEATVESTAANVTLWNGDAPADLDGSGNVLASVELLSVTAQQQVRDALLLAPTAGDPAAGSVDKHLDDILEDTGDILQDTGMTLPALIAVGVGPGSGTGYYTDTIDDGTNPLDGVRVQLYTGSSRVGLAYEAYTNALGVFEMWPDPGVYYRWLDLAGYNFSQDVAVTVTEP